MLQNKSHTYNFTSLFENALIILFLPANTDKEKKKANYSYCGFIIMGRKDMKLDK